MSNQPSSTSLDAALRDLRERTLDRLQTEIAKLVYLASTRNYNTGAYEHDGLVFHFTSEVAQSALATAHREIFENLALEPLETLTDQLTDYITSECEVPNELLRVWNELEAYRILVPVGQSPLIVQLFMSNLAAALAIVRESLQDRLQPDRPTVPPLPSLGR